MAQVVGWLSEHLPDDAPVRADDDETAVGVVAEPGVVEDALGDVEPLARDVRDAVDARPAPGEQVTQCHKEDSALHWPQ